MSAATHCQGCGVELSPAKSATRNRKWCSERCRKRQYAGTCVDCGDPTNGYNGRESAGERCLSCHVTRLHEMRYWTPERIVQAIKAWGDELGRAPTARECFYGRPSWVPAVATIQLVLGSWNAAIAAAGFTPCPSGSYRRPSNRKHARRSTGVAA